MIAKVQVMQITHCFYVSVYDAIKAEGYLLIQYKYSNANVPMQPFTKRAYYFPNFSFLYHKAIYYSAQQ